MDPHLLTPRYPLVPVSDPLPVQKLDAWASKHVEYCPLHMLKDAVIGVNATYYLNLRLNGNNEEPLKHALGGLPFTFKKAVEEDITFLKQNGITLIFVFDGLDYINKSLPNSQSVESRRVQDGAWHHYLNGDSKRTVTDFGKAEYDVDPTARSLQKLLVEQEVEYIVAPYSATAQVCPSARASTRRDADKATSCHICLVWKTSTLMLSWAAPSVSSLVWTGLSPTSTLTIRP
jgi:hypothetical protein